MVKSPMDISLEHFKQKIIRDQKRNEFIYRQTDNFVTWLIGFAFTGLLLIIGNLKSINEQFNAPIKPLIISLLAVIISGIAFRFISFLIMNWERELEEYYAILFATDTSTPPEPTIDVEEATVEDFVARLQNEFGVDCSYALHIDEKQKLIDLPKLKKIYLDHCAVAMDSLLRARSYIAMVEYETHRIPIKENEKAFDTAMHQEAKVGYRSRRWSAFRTLCFTLTLLAFITAIIITGISLLLFK
jgi:heme/copper-type cytochrome/quinol oxidase subunit 4